MEFTFDINNLFEDEISVVTSDLKPFRNQPGNLELKKQLHQVIDKMGVASSKAQGLDRVITSAMRLGCADHRLYVIKDADANMGKGAVVGILKMGNRKLFVYDSTNKQHEMEPTCVLDFYIHESRQRTGMGKKLYAFMLKHEGVSRPAHLAIDRPSSKFQGFLQKHYGLKAKIPQVNNFVIYDGFFRERPKEALNNRIASAGRLPPIPVDKQKESNFLNEVNPRSPNPAERRPGSDRDLLTGQQSSYSRHMVNSASPQHESKQQQPLQQQQYPAQQPAPLPVHQPVEQIRKEPGPEEPPLLSRNGPSQDFLSFSRQTRNMSGIPANMTGGALPGMSVLGTPSLQQPATSSQSNSILNPPPATHSSPSMSPASKLTPSTDPFAPRSLQKPKQDTSWNVFGVPNAPGSATAGARKMQHTRLW